ncbi:MAG: hypothetical protein BWX92_02768 [Deltaproteobacteria bacterium ADurb.Bin135]|jgi:hypothetical protein|nr:MAG: hypothetical protein BWX92_02768 [Deltaproteobacteria bacterium ADurb.Bin135]
MQIEPVKKYSVPYFNFHIVQFWKSFIKRGPWRQSLYGLLHLRAPGGNFPRVNKIMSKSGHILYHILTYLFVKAIFFKGGLII